MLIIPTQFVAWCSLTYIFIYYQGRASQWASFPFVHSFLFTREAGRTWFGWLIGTLGCCVGGLDLLFREGPIAKRWLWEWFTPRQNESCRRYTSCFKCFLRYYVPTRIIYHVGEKILHFFLQCRVAWGELTEQQVFHFRHTTNAHIKFWLKR